MPRSTKKSASKKKSPVRVVLKNKHSLEPYSVTDASAAKRRAALRTALNRNARSLGSREAAAKQTVRRLQVLSLYRSKPRKNETEAVRARRDTYCNRLLADEAWLRKEYGLPALVRKNRSCPNDRKRPRSASKAKKGKGSKTKRARAA